MKCKTCGGPMSINAKGNIECPKCSKITSKLTIQKYTHGSFYFFKSIKAVNIIVDEFLLPEEVQALIDKGVEVNIK
jgi:hypothetical protein